MSSGGSRYRELADTADTRCAGVIEGPWWASTVSLYAHPSEPRDGTHDHPPYDEAAFDEWLREATTVGWGDIEDETTAAFIAWSRSGVPEMAAALREADALLQRWLAVGVQLAAHGCDSPAAAMVRADTRRSLLSIPEPERNQK